MSWVRVGDTVQIRTWEDMEAEYGLTYSGTIQCAGGFTERMRQLGLEGTGFTVTAEYNGCLLGHDTGWTITSDMVNVLVRPATNYRVGDFVMGKFDTHYCVRSRGVVTAASEDFVHVGIQFDNQPQAGESATCHPAYPGWWVTADNVFPIKPGSQPRIRETRQVPIENPTLPEEIMEGGFSYFEEGRRVKRETDVEFDYINKFLQKAWKQKLHLREMLPVDGHGRWWMDLPVGNNGLIEAAPMWLSYLLRHMLENPLCEGVDLSNNKLGNRKFSRFLTQEWDKLIEGSLPCYRLFDPTMVAQKYGELAKGARVKLCLTVNPADQLLCSTNAGFSSCFRIPNGAYANAPSVYAMSPQIAMLAQYDSSMRLISRAWVGVVNREFFWVGRIYGTTLSQGLLKTFRESLQNQLSPGLWKKGDYAFGNNRPDQVYWDSPSAICKKDGSSGLYPEMDWADSICLYCGGEVTQSEGPVGCDDCTGHECATCGERISRGGEYVFDGVSYCADCYHERYASCYRCGDTDLAEDMTLIDHEFYCRCCRDRNFTRCDDCDEWVPDTEIIRTAHQRDICRGCYEDSYISCEECGDVIIADSAVEVDGSDYCEGCAPEIDEDEEEEEDESESAA